MSVHSKVNRAIKLWCYSELKRQSKSTWRHVLVSPVSLHLLRLLLLLLLDVPFTPLSDSSMFQQERKFNVHQKKEKTFLFSNLPTGFVLHRLFWSDCEAECWGETESSSQPPPSRLWHHQRHIHGNTYILLSQPASASVSDQSSHSPPPLQTSLFKAEWTKHDGHGRMTWIPKYKENQFLKLSKQYSALQLCCGDDVKLPASVGCRRCDFSHVTFQFVKGFYQPTEKRWVELENSILWFEQQGPPKLVAKMLQTGCQYRKEHGI